MLPGQSITQVRRAFEDAINRGDYTLLEALLRPTCVDHGLFPMPAAGREGIIWRIRLFREAFAGLRFTVYDMAAEADRVALRWQLEGRHLAPFGGVPASGKEFRLTGINIERFLSGLIVEHWSVANLVSLCEQIGGVPQPEQIGRAGW